MSKVVVFEIVAPLIDAETLEKEYEPVKEEIPLHTFLGAISNEVALTAMYLDGEDDEVMETTKGYIVRTRISDEEWVKMTSDRANYDQGPEDDQ